MAGADEERPEAAAGEQAYGLARLLALSDGVFAFALTLLVVQLAVPSGPSAQLGAELLDQLPSYFSYVLSFGVISLYWYQHHRIFRYVRRWDPLLITLNLGVLLFIAVMPFPTAILGRYGDQPLAVIIYAAILGATGTLMWRMWRHAIAKRLFTTSLHDRSARVFAWRAFLTPAIFFASIPVAVWAPRVAQVLWGVIWIGQFVLARRART